MPEAVSYGLVALVGAGPGRADLITVRGRYLLEHADVVVHDRLDTEELLARAGSATPAGRARLVNVGKQAGAHPVPQGEINRILIREAAAARLVVRLKGGDPYVFGRGGEEASALAEVGVPFEVVSGVTSALEAFSPAACGGWHGQPRRHLARRGRLGRGRVRRRVQELRLRPVPGREHR
ncbi:uroporphyrinogen-III C-methyltransferase [Olsenella uli]|uniref:uroporphyrinogen-III C-methyltransferase n=1 Tax=Olsenella uli TaxID=133926 RepID=UPI0016511BA8|nr:SAM-dependent methyltransferase [Olsenella uli]